MTNMIKKIFTFILLASAVVAMTAWAAESISLFSQAGEIAHPDLTGKWRLNRDLSDEAQKKLDEIMGGGGGRGGHGAGHGGGVGSDGHAGKDEVLKLIVNAPSQFVLTQDEHKVVLTEPAGRVRTLPTDNRKVQQIDGQDVRTKWENSRLVSEITVGNAKVTETYERSATTPQLIVTVAVAMQGQQISVRRVYDAVK